MQKHDLQIESIREETGRVRVQSKNTKPSRTQKQFKEQADINNIMRKYEKTGQITHVAKRRGFYADVSQYLDYQQMLEKIQQADDAFMAMSASVRKKFDNDPRKLIAFLADANNKEEAIELGLIEKPAPPAPQGPPSSPSEEPKP